MLCAPNTDPAKGGMPNRMPIPADWERHVVTCPAGKQNLSWLPSTYPQKGVAFEARFARKDCTPCLRDSESGYAASALRSMRLAARCSG